MFGLYVFGYDYETNEYVLILGHPYYYNLFRLSTGDKIISINEEKLNKDNHEQLLELIQEPKDDKKVSIEFINRGTKIWKAILI